ncbi:MAG: hypothetical protein ACP5OV_00440 [Acidimicrobiales bacterium]
MSRALATVAVVDVKVNGSWCYTSNCLALVQLVNSNGVFPSNEDAAGAYVQDLGTIQPGSSSDHVLNMRYDASVQEFEIAFEVWYLP